MLRQLLVGAGASTCNIVVHALVMTVVVRVTRTVGSQNVWHPWLLLIFVMIAVVSILMLAHTSEVIVWSLTYAAANAAPVGADLVYFAFVNARLWRCDPGRGLATAWANNGNEQRAAVRLVDSCHF
jgi:hypothetical protein